MPRFILHEVSSTATQKLFRGMDWEAELEARLKKAKKDNTKNAAVRQLYMDFIEIEFSPKASDKKLWLFFKSIEPTFYEQLETIGFSERVNPFIRYLRFATGLDPRFPDYKVDINADRYNAIHNAYLDRYLSATMIASLSDYNILWCRDLYKRHSGDMSSYFDLQSDCQKLAADTKIVLNKKVPALDEDGKEKLDADGNVIMQSRVLNPKSIIPRLFFEQPAVPDTAKTIAQIAEYCLYYLEEDDVVLATDPSAKLRPTSFIRECLRVKPFVQKQQDKTVKKKAANSDHLLDILNWINGLSDSQKASVIQTLTATSGYIANPEVKAAYTRAINKVSDARVRPDAAIIAETLQKMSKLGITAVNLITILDGIQG